MTSRVDERPDLEIAGFDMPEGLPEAPMTMPEQQLVRRTGRPGLLGRLVPSWLRAGAHGGALLPSLVARARGNRRFQ